MQTSIGTRRGKYLWWPIQGLSWAFVRLPRSLWRSFRRLSSVQQIALGTVLLVAFGAVGYFGTDHYLKKRQRERVMIQWRLFEEAAGDLDVEKMHQCLNTLEEYTPDDPRIPSRRTSLQTGEADGSDSVMILFWINRHLQNQRIEEAAREATKRISSVSKDWLSRCVLADHAFRKGRIDEGIAHLKELPSPFTDGRVFAGPFQYAFILHRTVGPHIDAKRKEAWYIPAMNSLRSYQATKLVPVMKSSASDKIPLNQKIHLLQCYLQSFEDLDAFPELPSFWVYANRLAQGAVEDPQISLLELLRLGELQAAFLVLLDDLKEKKKFEGSAVQELIQDAEDRVEFLWRKVLEREPKTPQAYIGLARLALRQKKTQEGLTFLQEGQDRCGFSTELLRERAILLQQTNPQAAVLELEKAVQGSQDPEAWWIFFQASMRVSRLDKAKWACQEARKLKADLLWACLFEAQVCLNQNHHIDALELLGPFKEHVGKHPKVTHCYLQALLQARAEASIEKLLQTFDPNLWPLEETAPILTTLWQAGKLEWVSKQADHLAKKYPGRREPRVLQAEVYRRWAEPGEDGVWNRDRVQNAIVALRWLSEREGDNLEAIHQIVRLQLKALKTPDTAWLTAEPLRRAEKTGRLTIGMKHTLGSLNLAIGKYDEARQWMESSLTRDTPAEVFIDLALVFHQLNRAKEANNYLDKAASMNRTPRETYELNQARKTIQGK